MQGRKKKRQHQRNDFYAWRLNEPTLSAVNSMKPFFKEKEAVGADNGDNTTRDVAVAELPVRDIFLALRWCGGRSRRRRARQSPNPWATPHSSSFSKQPPYSPSSSAQKKVFIGPISTLSRHVRKGRFPTKVPGPDGGRKGRFARRGARGR